VLTGPDQKRLNIPSFLRLLLRRLDAGVVLQGVDEGGILGGDDWDKVPHGAASDAVLQGVDGGASAVPQLAEVGET
jgi:hypothetical protein